MKNRCIHFAEISKAAKCQTNANIDNCSAQQPHEAMKGRKTVLSSSSVQSGGYVNRPARIL